MMALAYAPDLVEEAVLLAERTLPCEERRAFRRERDELYALPDQDQRESRFRNLHRRWFVRLGLDRGIEQAVAERFEGSPSVFPTDGRVVAAVARREEGADLVDRVVPGTVGVQPLLIIRIRPSTLLDPGAVRSLLRHELMHVTDMLDPAFGYERALAASGDGPSSDTILRDRYRVLWDVTIDGRLARAGQHAAATRTARWHEFAATFPMLGQRGRHLFDSWFDLVQPTHAALAAFARTPTAVPPQPFTDTTRT